MMAERTGADEDKVNAYDLGFLYGMSLFETFLVGNRGQVFLLDKHIKRLLNSLSFFEIELGLSAEELAYRIIEYIQINEIRDRILRVTVSAGNREKVLEPGIFFTMRNNNYSPEKINMGCILTVSDIRRNETSLLNNHKTSNRMENYFVGQAAIRKGYDDAVFLNIKDQVTETTKSNIFFISNGVIYTPHIQCGLLPGITRDWVIEKATSAGINCIEASYSWEDLYNADEVFITNSVQGIIHVRKINDKVYNDGSRGEITKLLTKELWLLLRRSIDF